MAGLFDYTNSNIPAEAFLFRQGNALPPDVAQMATANQSPSQVSAQQTPSGIPAYLTPNPMAPKDATPSGLDAYLHMNQAVKAYNPQSVSRPNPTISDYGRMANTAAAEQWAGIDQIQKYIEDLKGQPQGINYSPLAAYIDAQDPSGKSHLTQMAEAMAPMTPDQKQKMITDLQLKLQGDRNDISKGQLAALGQQIQMQHNAEMLQHYANMDAANAGRTQSYLDRVNVQRDNQTAQAGNIFDRDPIMSKLQERQNQIGIDNHTLWSMQQVPSQIMDELSMGLAVALNGGRSAGLEQTKMQQINSLEKDIAKAKSYWNGQPTAALTDDQRQFLQNTLNRLNDAYGQVRAARAQQIRQGRNYTFNPQANAALDAKLKTYTDTGSGSGGLKTASTSPESMSDAALYEQWKKLKGQP